MPNGKFNKIVGVEPHIHKALKEASNQHKMFIGDILKEAVVRWLEEKNEKCGKFSVNEV